MLEAVVAGEPAGPATSLRDRMDAGRRLAAQVPDGLLADLLAEMPLTVTATTPRLVRRAASTYPDGIEVAARVRAQSDADDAALAAALGTTTARVAPARAALDGARRLVRHHLRHGTRHLGRRAAGASLRAGLG